MHTIQFKDTEAILEGFSYSQTYKGWLEGHPMYVSWHLLRELSGLMERDKSVIFVHQGELVNADRLNEIEHFESDKLVSQYIDEVMRPNGVFWPKDSDNFPYIVLKKGRYIADFHINHEQLLTVIWYDDEIDINKPLIALIERKVKDIEYTKYCSHIDYDDM